MIALLVAILPSSEVVEVDRLEVNHVYSVELNDLGNGYTRRHRLSQLIAWERDECGRWRVRDWWMLSSASITCVRGRWLARVTRQGKTITLRARQIVTICSDTDREIDDRARWPEDCRNGIR